MKIRFSVAKGAPLALTEVLPGDRPANPPVRCGVCVLSSLSGFVRKLPWGGVIAVVCAGASADGGWQATHP
ncbi:hypothetical protein, partial [Denitromonas sp.]|uniref:hypothetical protein n=1 Tax=Denitromonas sp. TaxID=2734609 RepID=UPI002FDD2C88